MRQPDLEFHPPGHPGDSDALLNELQESIPQGVPNSTQYEGVATYGRRATDVVDTDLASLDDLLNSSLEAKKVEDQYKVDREARKRGYAGLSKEEVDFCNSRMHAFEMAREWQADRAIAVFVQNECEHCGEVRTIFSRLMEHHNHRFVRTGQRWVSVTKTDFQPEPVLESRSQPFCLSCMGEFEMTDDPVAWPWFDEVVMGDVHS